MNKSRKLILICGSLTLLLTAVFQADFLRMIGVERFLKIYLQLTPLLDSGVVLLMFAIGLRTRHKCLSQIESLICMLCTLIFLSITGHSWHQSISSFDNVGQWFGALTRSPMEDLMFGLRIVQIVFVLVILLSSARNLYLDQQQKGSLKMAHGKASSQSSASTPAPEMSSASGAVTPAISNAHSVTGFDFTVLAKFVVVLASAIFLYGGYGYISNLDKAFDRNEAPRNMFGGRDELSHLLNVRSENASRSSRRDEATKYMLAGAIVGFLGFGIGASVRRR